MMQPQPKPRPIFLSGKAAARAIIALSDRMAKLTVQDDDVHKLLSVKDAAAEMYNNLPHAADSPPDYFSAAQRASTSTPRATLCASVETSSQPPKASKLPVPAAL